MTMDLYNNTTGDSDDALHTESLFDLRYFLVRIFYPCLLIWGIIGNSLCLRVLLSKKFFKNSTCQYLASLAVIDILFILMRSSKHIYKLFQTKTIFNTSMWVCRILTSSSSALAHMGSWILVIVSFDRYFTVTSRYRRRGSAANRVFCSTIILIVVVALCNLHYFFILGITKSPNPSQHDQQSNKFLNISENNATDNKYDPNTILPSILVFMCVPKTGYQTFFGIYIPIFDILLVAVIPFLLLCFTNISIFRYTMRTNRQMRQNHKRINRRNQRLTIMLLSVTLAFIGFTCPSVICICVNKIIYSARMPEESKTNPRLTTPTIPSNVQSIIDICEALWYTKHAMNFILYTLSGQDFRKAFIKSFPKCFRARPLVLNKLIKSNQPRSNYGNDTSSIEITNITHTNNESRSKSPINYNHNLSISVSSNSRATSLTQPQSV